MEHNVFLLVSFESLKPTHFRQLPMFLPFPVRLQSLPFNFRSTSTVLWPEGPPKGILQCGTRPLWVSVDKLMLISKFRIWGPIKALVSFHKCLFFLCSRMSKSLDLKDRKYMLYDEMMAFLVTITCEWWTTTNSEV